MKKFTCSFVQANFFRFTSKITSIKPEKRSADKVKVEIDLSNHSIIKQVDDQLSSRTSTKTKVKREKTISEINQLKEKEIPTDKNNEIRKTIVKDKHKKEASEGAASIKKNKEKVPVQKEESAKSIISKSEKRKRKRAADLQLKTKRTSEFDYLCTEDSLLLAIRNKRRHSKTIISNLVVPQSRIEFVNRILELAKINSIQTMSIASQEFGTIYSDANNVSVTMKCSKLDYDIIDSYEFFKRSTQQLANDLIVVTNNIASQDIVAKLFRSSLFYGASNFVVTKNVKPEIDARFSILSGGSIEEKSIYAALNIYEFINSARADGYKVIEVSFEKELCYTEIIRRQAITNIIPDNLALGGDKHIIIFSMDWKAVTDHEISREVDYRIMISTNEFFDYSILTTVILNRILSKIKFLKQNIV